MRIFIKFRRLLAAFAIGSAASTFAAQAMSVEPLLLELSSFGKGTTQSFRVANNGAEALPVEVNISKMEIGPDGQLRYEAAESDFLIYPPQANIPKGGAQNFRVQWIGDPDIKQSRNYRISVSQVPIKLAPGTSGIQITMNFGVIVGVSPPDGKAAIVAMRATAAKDNDGKRVAALSVKNPGNKYAYLGKAAIRLSGIGWSAKLGPYEVQQKIGLGIIQPGKERRFLIPVEVPPNVSDITASIDYQPEK